MSRQWTHPTDFGEWTITYHDDSRSLHWCAYLDEYSNPSGGGYEEDHGHQPIIDFQRFGPAYPLPPTLKDEINAFISQRPPSADLVPLSILLYLYPEPGASIHERVVTFKAPSNVRWTFSIDSLTIDDIKYTTSPWRLFSMGTLVYATLPAGNHEIKASIKIESQGEAPAERYIKAQGNVLLQRERSSQDPQVMELHVNLSHQKTSAILKRSVLSSGQEAKIIRALLDGWILNWSYFSDYHGRDMRWEERAISCERRVFRDKYDNHLGPVHDLTYDEREFTNLLKQDETLSMICLEAYENKRRQISEQIIAKLDLGKQLYSGGEDYRGAEVYGGESSLSKEGDSYRYKDAEWGSTIGRRESNELLSLTQLKDKLAQNDAFFDFCKMSLKD